MLPKEILRRVVVSATILMVAFADMGRKVNLSRLVDITGKTSLAPTIGTHCLAAPDLQEFQFSVLSVLQELAIFSTSKLKN